ncbi:MAG: cob(I)yrinic acid a,c-diamide adenosyltransferase [Kiritimatiellia bacterium]
MHVYTRQGDDGRTVLINGERVGKDDPRVRAGGAADELCSWLGMLVAELQTVHPEQAMQLRHVQVELFAVGAVAQLQGHGKGRQRIRLVGARECSRIERWIDAIEAEVPPLDGFILPGGCRAAAATHVARSVCRRLECDLVALSRTADAKNAAVMMNAVAYVNRLADYLFVLARFCNHIAHVEEPVRAIRENP